LEVRPGSPVLVISGPNTGGKTVALKTVGLFALMAQCGLHVPAAEGSRLPVFRRIFADIGDEQSITADLSTFSAHLAAIVEMTRDLELPALVLLDEVGAGTDPTEGGGLGVAIVEHFRACEAMVVATTHHGQMKAYAQATDGVTCASFGYDPETYEPTYRLSLGTPGRSLALEMAERLGLPPAVVADARARLSEGAAQTAALLRQLEAERAGLASERESIVAQRGALEQERRSLRRTEAELAARKQAEAESFARGLRKRSEEAARKANEAIERAVRRVETTRRSAASVAARARSEAVRAIRHAQEEVLRDPALGLPDEPQESPGELIVGGRVRVRELGVVGELVKLRGDQADVSVQGKRMRVPSSALVNVAGGSKPRADRKVSVGLLDVPRRSEVPGEINLVGLTVDEALPRVDKLLDDAALSERHELRVIHGFGQGRLRKAVAGLLEGHPHVSTFRLGGAREGGAGVTIVELKD
jgi:DNA mismatch repair protein MutS2